MNWQWSAHDLGILHVFLTRHNLAGASPPRLTPIGDGHSNLTYRLDGAACPLVLRRPPHPLPPPGANDLGREARLLRALGPTGLPVPRIFASAQAGDPFAFPFYLMDLVEGDVITTRLPDRFANAQCAEQMGHAMLAMLAALHPIDWRGVGLDDFGKPEGFNARHLNRIARLVTDPLRAAYPAFTEVQDWLERHCPPESGDAIIHNDFRIGNLMWAPSPPPRLAAIFDWELATIGDPMLDLAYLLASLPRDGTCRNPVQDLASACLAPGFPDSATLAAQYGALTGRSPDRINWYMAMVNWKLAALYAYSRERGIDPYYADETQVPRFLDEARHHCQS